MSRSTARSSGSPKSAKHKAALAEDNPDEYVLSEQIGHLLRRAYQRHTSIFQVAIPDEKLTSVQFAVLTTVRDNPHSPLVHIGRLTAIDHATLRDIVSRLKRRGLVTMKTGAEDKRQRIVALTDEGEDLVRDIIPEARNITELTLKNLDACERVAALAILKKLSQD